MACRRGARGFAHRRFRGRGDRFADRRQGSRRHLRAAVRSRVHRAGCDRQHADHGHAPSLHRPGRSRCLQDAALEHRGRGSALPRRGWSLGCGLVSSRPASRGDHRGDGRRRPCGGGRVVEHPGRVEGVLQDQRDHHVADAQLRRRPPSHLSDLRQPFVLARAGHFQRESVSTGQAAAGCRDVADIRPRGRRDSIRLLARIDRSLGVVALLSVHKLRLPGARAGGFAFGGAIRGHQDAKGRGRDDGSLRSAGRRWRGKRDRRFPPRPRPARPAAGGFRLCGNRGRGAGAIQPVRRGGGRVFSRRPGQCGLQPAKARLSRGVGRGPAGDGPVLPTRRGAAPPPPGLPQGPPFRRALLNVNDNIVVVLAASAIFYGTPLVFAAMGELLAERSGVLNLGVEGMMLTGAVTAFWAVQHLGGPDWLVLLLATMIGGLAALAVSVIHAVLVVGLRANQIVSGLALTIFAGATGLSSYVGNVARLGGQPAHHEYTPINVLGLADVPVLGPILFHPNPLVYASWALVLVALAYLHRTRTGLHVRAVGESPQTADVMGIDVARYRYAHTLAGGLLAGVGGAYFSLAITPNWIDGMTSGAGWIAIALVIFAFWRPELTLAGASLFGLFSSLGFVLQARQVHLPPEVFASLPYLMTVVVLVAVSTGWARQRLGPPARPGTPHLRGERSAAAPAHGPRGTSNGGLS